MTCRFATRRRLAVAVATLLSVLDATGSLTAQATTVTLQGVISAPGGAPPGARVDVRNRETGVVRHVLADSNGVYRALGVAPGTYDITARAIGYRPQAREAVQLLVAQRATLDFTLERGGQELAPTIITADRAFEINRTDVSTAVTPREIERLPLNARNVLNLAAVAPGIRTFAVEGGRSAPASGALPEREPRFSNLYVDGVEWKGTYVGQVMGGPSTGSMIPQEALQEFRVYVNSYDAEYGRGASHVISGVSHRGGNELEGSLFGFLQNRDLVAKGGFQATEAEYRRYQLGGNVRGPIIRDRLFFAASYEGNLTDDYITVVPGRPAEDPGRWDEHAGAFRAPSRNHTALVRLTAPFGLHSLDAIWATRQLTAEGNYGISLAGIPLSREAGVVGGSRVTSLQLRDTYAASSFLNELTFHLLELTNGQDALAPGSTLRYKGIQFGRSNFPFELVDRHIRLINKTSWGFDRAGSHVVKGGVEVHRTATRIWRPTAGHGSFDFPTDTSTLPNRATIAVGVYDPASMHDARGAIDGWVIGAYLQDQWQPIPSLTITAGLRYDVELNTLNQDFITPRATDTTLVRIVGDRFLNSGDRRADVDNIAPRIAVSWDPLGRGRTFFRAGRGVMYDRIPLFGALQERIATRWRTYNFSNPGTTDPAELRARIAAGGREAPRNIFLFKDRMEAPENHQWSAGIGHQLTDRVAVNVDYVSQRVKHAYVTVNLNQSVNGTRPLTSRFGNLLLWDDFGDAESQAFLTSVTFDRRPTRLNVAYTLGWAKSEFGQFTTNDYADSSAYTMQESEGDERHRFVLSGLTALPFDLDLSGIVIVASPRPTFATIGEDINQNGSSSDDWPNGIRTIRAHGWEHWYRTVDVRLGKEFATRGGRVVVTAEVFNLFNSANHSEYQGTQTLLGFGEPTGDYPRRQGQLGMRFEF